MTSNLNESGSFPSQHQDSVTARKVVPPAGGFPRAWFVLAGLLAVAGLLFATAALRKRHRQLTDSVARLSWQVGQLERERAMPSAVLAEHRGSICYVYADYELHRGDGRPGKPFRLRISGTGFVVSGGRITTNKHVLEPVFENSEARASLRRGAVPARKTLVAFFPDLSSPVPLSDVRYSPNADLAVARFDLPKDVAIPPPLNLAGAAPAPGESVIVVGYPMGVAGMVAKSPKAMYELLAGQSDTVRVASQLAASSLIRPSATYGRLSDVVGNKLLYDAPTAHGASGGPVFNMRGEVVGVNTAYVNGFSGASLGITVDELRKLLQETAPGRER